MKILVTYYSKTGNTKAVADAIYEALGKKDKDIKPIEEARNIEDYSLIFCGFPIYAHSVPVPAQNFIKSIPSGTNLALFSTHGALREGKMSKEALEHAIGLAKDAKVIGTFNCRGKVPQDVLDSLMDKPEHRAWAQMTQSAKSHPDESDIGDAKTFALDILKKGEKFDAFPVR